MSGEPAMIKFTCVPIVGMKWHAGALEAVRALPDGSTLTLRRDPANPKDANAIEVYDATERPPQKLGFILAVIAEKMAHLMDAAGLQETTCRYDKGDGRNPTVYAELPSPGQDTAPWNGEPVPAAKPAAKPKRAKRPGRVSSSRGERGEYAHGDPWFGDIPSFDDDGQPT